MAHTGFGAERSYQKNIRCPCYSGSIDSTGLLENTDGFATRYRYPDVYDLDVSDYPDAGEQVEADDKEAELNKRIVQPGWRSVW